MSKRVYISLPMGGHEDTVKYRYDKAVHELYDKKYLTWTNGDIAIGPCNIDQFTEDGILSPRDHDWAYYMGQDIEILLRCNAIYMTKGYLLSPGCRLELAAARERDMQVIYAEDAQEFLNTKAECKQ